MVLLGQANITFSCWAHDNVHGGDDSHHHHHFGKDLFDSIRSSIFLGDSKPGRSRLFTFRICLFVVGLCRTVQFVPKKKSPLQNFSFLAHPSLYLFPHFSLSWELPLFAWVSKCYHDTMTFTYNRFKIANSQTCFDNFRLFPAAPPNRHNPCLLFV